MKFRNLIKCLIITCNLGKVCIRLLILKNFKVQLTFDGYYLMEDYEIIIKLFF